MRCVNGHLLRAPFRPGHPSGGDDGLWLPPQVLRLAWREREIATIIYSRGASTAKDVECALNGQISNAAVRSMLGRLVTKGMLRREGGSPGGRGYVYVPAMSAEDVAEQAIRQVSELYFRGSVAALARRALQLTRLEPERKCHETAPTDAHRRTAISPRHSRVTARPGR